MRIQCHCRGLLARRLLQTLRQQRQQQQLQQQRQQQQPGPQRPSSKEAVCAAWQGYYQYWGPGAATTIQRHWRGWCTRRQLQRQHKAVTCIQAAWR